MLSDNYSRQKAIEEHIDKYAGEIKNVFHEITSPDIHLDVYWVKSVIEDQEVNILITGGMSEKPMNTPEGLEDYKYAELCIFLPADWKLDVKDFEDENNYWPVRLLKDSARFPHKYNTWIGVDHTTANGNPPQPYADNIDFCGSYFFVPISLDENFFVLNFNNIPIRFYCIFPLYKEELDLKLNQGSNALLKKLEDNDVYELVDINRINTCA